jgi:hypothetical protein
MDCRASLAMTVKSHRAVSRHREARSDPSAVSRHREARSDPSAFLVIARHEAIHGLPRFARNDGEESSRRFSSSRGTKRSIFMAGVNLSSRTGVLKTLI